MKDHDLVAIAVGHGDAVAVGQPDGGAGRFKIIPSTPIFAKRVAKIAIGADHLNPRVVRVGHGDQVTGRRKRHGLDYGILLVT